MKKLLLIFILILISCNSIDVDETIESNKTTENSGKIYFENKTCICPNAKIGDTDIINGKTYIAVDNSTITVEMATGNFNLCTTLVTDMSGSSVTITNFFNDNSFNSDISFWDVSNVTNMDGMFFDTDYFNQNISYWNISRVTNMGSMFKNASSFNQNIENWDTSNVTKMLGLFSNATTFNQDIGEWNTSNVASMFGLFTNAIAFNQDIGEWNTSNVNNMSEMFQDASAFNQDLTGWCVTNIQFEPLEFSLNSALTSTYKPVWGNCPD